ncbi:MAG: orotidine-5'-phosphate decarboxylase [Fimbriimonadaceae bacterium]
MGNRKIICALDTGDITEAIKLTRKLAPHVGAFKIGHALTLQHGLDVISQLQDAGANRIFLDLKFHDIPNSVALAVREAAKRHVWMMTLHISGGPAMLTAAVEEAREAGVQDAPLLMGVSVLTSLDQHALTEHLGITRQITDHMVQMSKLAVDCGIDGVICSPQEIRIIRQAIGHAVIVSPGIRVTSETQDQVRTGSAASALSDGADYLVVGRALTATDDVEKALESLGLEPLNSR